MIKLLVMDVDGVLTDGRKYYDRNGTVQLKIFCDKDWTAIKRFVAIGVNVCFITGDEYNRKILENRNYETIVCRTSGSHIDKSEFLLDVMLKHRVTKEETAFIGDDLFDVKAMQSVGYSVCPSDSPAIVREQCNLVLPVPGGSNCIMHLFDHLERYSLIDTENFQTTMQKIYDLDVKEKF